MNNVYAGWTLDPSWAVTSRALELGMADAPRA